LAAGFALAVEAVGRVAVAVRAAPLDVEDVARAADVADADGLGVVEVAALAPVATAVSGAGAAASAPGARTSATF
jgi:hypothetical protein